MLWYFEEDEFSSDAISGFHGKSFTAVRATAFGMNPRSFSITRSFSSVVPPSIWLIEFLEFAFAVHDTNLS